jgi:hypothetical protein
MMKLKEGKKHYDTVTTVCITNLALYIRLQVFQDENIQTLSIGVAMPSNC